MSDFGKLMAPLRRSLGNMIARGVVAAVNAATKMQTLQIRLMADEPKSDVEHIEPYGFTSNPIPGAEVVALFPDGDRSHGFVVAVTDRRYRLQGLLSGEMAIHDDQGQKVHLTRAGIVVKGAGLPILLTDTPTVTIEAGTSVVLDAPVVDVKHQLIVRELITGQGGMTLQGSGAGAAATISGSVQVTSGDVLVSGGDVQADVIRLKAHKHTGVQPGAGNTGAATP